MCTRVYVGNLPLDVRTREVEDIFYKYGRIRDIDIKQPSRPPAYAFVDFEDHRDAHDAIRGRNNYDFDGYRLRVEEANGGKRGGGGGGRDGRAIGGGTGGSGDLSTRSEHSVIVSSLPTSASWQDLKDHMRKAGGEILFTKVDGRGKGVVEYKYKDDMYRAIDKLDDTEFRNKFDKAYIRIKRNRDSGKSSRRSRSPSRSFSRSKSRSRSKDRKHRSASRSKSRSRSRSRSGERSRKKRQSRSRSYSRSVSRDRSKKSPDRRSRSYSRSKSRSHSKSKRDASKSRSRSRSNSKGTKKEDEDTAPDDKMEITEKSDDDSANKQVDAKSENENDEKDKDDVDESNATDEKIDWSSKKVVELRDVLKKKGLDTKGVKADLIKRLEEAA